eukprot:CAMPEP_0119318842 /NCGR_PEP_ID=MMETSP1333-20130426/47780_1 /TAXON_ID=418940 /ORGANISM="Scyphosphaera apsteinii, Strain RCC1455" /LENGTH=129 /DNA_ID=CAMNT_0007325133 /DNA_START=8 /DNA_END=397 /DNA_ORIENTATION=-
MTLIRRIFDKDDDDGNCWSMVPRIATGDIGIGTSTGRSGGAGCGPRDGTGSRGGADTRPGGCDGPGNRGGVGLGKVGAGLTGPEGILAHAACVCVWPPNKDMALLPASTQMLECLCSRRRRRSNLNAPS